MRNFLIRAARRFGWGLADQSLSSATNFALGIVVARSVDTASFGAFSLAVAVYMVVLGISRAIGSEPLIVRYSNKGEAEWRHGTRATTGTALILGIVTGAACVAVGAFLDQPLRSALPALGLTLPGLLVQDSWRFAFFARSNGYQAFLNDLVWALVLFPGLVFLEVTENATVGWVVMIWGASAGMAAIAGIIQTKSLPDPFLMRGWWEANRDLAGRYTGEYGLVSGSRQIGLFAITAVAGLDAVAAIRGGSLLLGPLNIVFAGLTLTVIPHGARIAQRSTERLLRFSGKASAAIALISVLWGAALLVLPKRFGVMLLGETWDPSRTVLVPLVLMTVFRGASFGPITGLRALAAARRSLRTQGSQAVLRLIAGTVGAWLAAASGAAWGFAAAASVEATMWWRQMFGAVRDTRQSSEDASNQDDVVR